MALLNPFLRSVEGGFAHWCPGCERMHVLPVKRGWTFNGNTDKPTFTPSFKYTSNEGTPPSEVCHYNLIDGALNFHNDCTHLLKGKSVPLPPIPVHE